MPWRIRKPGAAFDVLPRITGPDLVAGAKVPFDFEFGALRFERSLILECNKPVAGSLTCWIRFSIVLENNTPVTFVPDTGSCSTIASTVRICSGLKSGFPI